jgi:hypothetical protein
MFSFDNNQLLQHGASSTDGVVPVTFQFSGSRNVEEISEFKQKILTLVRYHAVERFLYEPVENFLPDPARYNLEDTAEQRQFELDREKVYLTATRAYALVKARFKPNSEAYAIIQQAEDTGRVDVLWRLFCTHYDNPLSTGGAQKLIQAFYEKPKNSELINLFITYTEHFNRIDQIEQAINGEAEANFMMLLSTTRNNFQTPIPRNGILASERAPARSTFPQWARVLHALYRIKQEVPKYDNLITKFLYENIGKKRNLELQRLTVEETLDQLKAFVIVFKEDEVKQEVRATKTFFFCKEHGTNPTHSTENCRFLKSRQHRQANKEGRSSRSRERSSGRERSNSRGRGRKFARSNSREKHRTQRSNSPYIRGYFNDGRAFHRSSSRERQRNRGEQVHQTILAKNEHEDHNQIGEKIDNHHIENQQNSDTLFQFYDYSITLHTNLTTECLHSSDEIIGDTGASAVIFNSAHANLVTQQEEIEGAIIGAAGASMGAIKAKGFTEFMGVQIPCYIANITKSVVGIGFLAKNYGFIMEIRGNRMYISSTLSGASAVISVDNSFLFQIPKVLFQRAQINVMLTCLSADSKQSLWHYRLGHIADRKLAFMLRQPHYQARGLVIKNPESIIRMQQYCDCCEEVKGRKIRSTITVDREASKLGMDWHVDLLGKHQEPALGTKNEYIVVFTDRYSRYRVVYGARSNDEAAIIQVVIAWNEGYVMKAKAWTQDQTSHTPISLYSDNLEFKYPGVQRLLASFGINQYFTAPRHSSSNGVAERSIGIIRTMARALMRARDLPEPFWEMAIRHACFLVNRIPFVGNGRFQRDPYFLWTGKTFDYAKLRIFGSRCYALKTDLKKDMSPRARMGIYVGHADSSNAYLVYIPTEDRICVTEDVRFQELARDIFAAQQTPEEVDELSNAIADRLNFQMSETTVN